MLHDFDDFGIRFLDRAVTSTSLQVLKDVENLAKTWLKQMYVGKLEMTAFIPTKDINVWIVSYTVIHNNEQETEGYLYFDTINAANIKNEVL